MRGLLQLVLLIAIGSLVALGVGELYAALHGGSQLVPIRVGFALVGLLAVLLGAAPGITLGGAIGSSITGDPPGRMIQEEPGVARINPTAIAIACGIVLVALAAVL